MQILNFYIKLHVSQPGGLRASPITMWYTDTWLRGVLVNVAVYPAILSCSRSQIVKSSPIGRAKNDAISNNAKLLIHKTLLIYLRVTEDMSTKLRKEHWSAIDKAVDCHSRK